MHISFVHIRNFRKLKNCSLDIEKDKTILVGPNNSGKTSVIAAFKRFLGDKGRETFVTRDFTLNLWNDINSSIGDIWEADFTKEEPTIKEDSLSLADWENNLPTFDLWIKAEDDESHLLKDLMAGDQDIQNNFGLRIRLEPDIKRLYNEYRKARLKVYKARKTIGDETLELYPNNIHDFLEKGHRLRKYFELKYYVLNPDIAFSKDGKYEFQELTDEALLETNPLKGLMVIDVIEANREFYEDRPNKDKSNGGLSDQFHRYHTTVHREDEVEYKEEDIPLLDELNRAHSTHNKKLEGDLKPLIDNISQINYPGFHNPAISIDSVINLADSIHTTSIQFSVDGTEGVKLHEDFNGLGYRNLLWMCVTLYIFKYARLHPKEARATDTDLIPPIHIVFIEEPEAHLHAQAQQVFINKIYTMINKPEPGLERYKSQLIISTHSNHIVNEIDPDNIRFFKRVDHSGLKISEIVSLKNIFGSDEETKKFVTRYIRLTHCDIYFADAVILVEGPAEKIMMKHFLTKGGFSFLSHCYVSVIEINGSHAHSFRNLIERLDIITLIITDIDAQEHSEGAKKDGTIEKRTKKVIPELGQNHTTNNDTLKTWIPKKTDIDALLTLKEDDKCVGNVRIAYQTGIKFENPDGSALIRYPYTFEDALILSNWDLFKTATISKSGALTTVCNLINEKADLVLTHEKLFEKLTQSFLKAEFAVNLLYAEEFEKLTCPEYIGEGLKWLADKIQSSSIISDMESKPEIIEDSSEEAHEEL